MGDVMDRMPFHERIFEGLQARWHRPSTRRGIGRFLIAAFFFSIGCIELARQGLVTEVFGRPLPTNHLAAIAWVFTLLLIVEILDLIFALAQSVANALGKQLEIFSLILIRKTFDELARLPEPIGIEGSTSVLLEMGALAGGALLVFVAIIFYYRLQRHSPISEDAVEVAQFVSFKKAICLLLLIAFLITGGMSGFRSLTVEHPGAPLSMDFFVVFFTALVFSDVLLVLASFHVTREYSFVFRNFAFTVVTVFLRIALVAPPYPKAILGSSAALFALAAAAAFELNRPRRDERE
ncbi:MAG: hypothetical protein CMJ88_11290 [Planctomycetes bacterium]|nr:hypothetical protein [Planctomycetota bacterium]